MGRTGVAVVLRLMAFAVLCSSAVAQQPGVAGTGGTVTGTVLLGDTQHGARFATVMLQALLSPDEGRDRGFGAAAGKTGVDGSFSIANVPVGDYYVLAYVPGYVAERTLLQAQLDAGAAVADVMAQIPMAHVTAGGSSSVTVTVQRGGTIAGRLQWEDGSVATGIRVSVTVVAAGTSSTAQSPLNGLREFGQNQADSDDRGAFRLTGLAGGDYLLQAVVRPTSGFQGGGRIGTAIQVYAPGVFHKADAKPITIRAGDERDDLRMVIDLHSLRTVSGHVSTSSAGLSVLSGRASLSDASDTTLQMTAVLQANGDFVIPYVPAGTYTLTVNGSTQPAAVSRGRGGLQTASAAFKPYTQTVTVGDTDVTGLGVSLVSAQAQ